MKKILSVILVFVLIYFERDFFVYRPILALFKTEKVKAKVINLKNSMRRGFITDAYTLSYSFNFKNNTYVGNVRETGLIEGDSVLVEFNSTFPFINRRIK